MLFGVISGNARRSICGSEDDIGMRLPLHTIARKDNAPWDNTALTVLAVEVMNGFRMSRTAWLCSVGWQLL
jgi:hypothetical protein